MEIISLFSLLFSKMGRTNRFIVLIYISLRQYSRYNIIFAIFCHKSHNTMSNDTPYWSKRYHIQKWKIYYRFLAHSNDYVYNRGKDKLKHIQHWLWPLVFSICVQFLPRVFEVFAIWSVVAKKLITYRGQKLLGKLQNCFYAF